MAVTTATKMPSDEELTVPQEITLSTPYMKAVASYMHVHCENEIKEFILRRRELEDPRKTLKEGAAVTACGVKFLQSLKRSCANETAGFADCIDQSSARLFISKCHPEREVLDKCVEENLKVHRPKMGYFSKPKVHDSVHPAPTPVLRDYKAEAAKVLSELPADYALRKDYRQYNDWRHNIKES